MQNLVHKKSKMKSKKIIYPLFLVFLEYVINF